MNINPSSDQQGPLRHGETNRSDRTNPIDSPRSPPRRTQRRKTSQGSITFADQVPSTATPSPSLSAFDFESFQGRAQGLGISGRSISISRVPVGTRSSLSPPTPSKPFFSTSTTAESSPYTPGLAKPFLSPQQRNDPGSYSFDGGGLPTMHEDEQDISTGRNTPHEDQFPASSGGYGGADVERGNQRGRESPNRQNDDENGSEHDKLDPLDGCPSKRDIHSSRKNWLSVSILILSIYSTVFSGIYLVLAIIQPRYGRNIQSGGKLTPETASVLFALFAKTIELSFVSVFVAFLGQVLSRRSLVKASRGVTIAELTMRTWVIQPAFMITHWETLKHAGLSILGMITLTNAFVAMFYTTASDSLVSPHLKYGDWNNQVMYGMVKTMYANPAYVASVCQNPTAPLDPEYASTTCLSILHAGQAHSNHITFLGNWTEIREKGEGTTTDLIGRPRAPAMLFDNTTVTGSWVSTEWSNMSASYEYYKRIVNNVTMAMPHAGIFNAAREDRNGILQPENLAGVGEYNIRAAVVSPAINVLCVNMNETELEPLIYVTWPNATITTGDQLPGQRLPKGGHNYENDIQPLPGSKFLNSTIVDDIFEWGPNYQRQPPVFPMYPIEYNSIINVTVAYAYTDAIYILVKAPNTITKDYTMCKLRSVISPKCSTRYSVSGKNVGQIESHCEDPDDEMAYHLSVPDAATVPTKDWINIGSEVLRALAFGTGISNANASSARLISQLITKMPESGLPKLNPLMPSIAESLAVMAGSSLLLSITDSTFYHYWNYTDTILEGTQLPFNASIQSQEYTSGYVQRWTAMFYLVLIIVFVTNVFCLVYFFIRSGLVTDYSEPQNLFALAVNSPASHRLSGSCGAGPEGGQFSIDWHVSQEEESGHFFIKEGHRGFARQLSLFGKRKQHPLKSATSYSKLSSKRRSWL